MSINTAQFLTVHSSDQCKVCLPSDVMRSPRPFLAILEYCKQSKSEAGETWEPGCATFLLLTQPVAKTMPFATSSDSYSRFNPSNLLLLMEYLDTVSP